MTFKMCVKKLTINYELFIVIILIISHVSNSIPNTSNNTVTTTVDNGNIKTAENAMFCSENKVLSSELKFTLYTQNNLQEGILLTEETLNQVDPNSFTTIIIHGWKESSHQGWIQKMKNVYLNKSADNIITVDWSIYSKSTLYPEAVCLIPQFGVIIGDLIYNLTKNGVSVKKVQINGFSLGGHISGAAGQRVNKLMQSKITRIIGLDAAGPEFFGKPISVRLDDTDADFVQAIHTSLLGYSSNYGTIDFYVNYDALTGCGTSQNGCPKFSGVPIDSLAEIDHYCDHVRAAAYLIESINSNNLIGKQCSSCLEFGNGLCKDSKVETVMGENCPRNETGGRYINVNSESPFAQG